MDTNIFEEAPESNAPSVGDAKRQVEKKARQLVYDARYDAKKELGGKAVTPEIMNKMVMQRIQKSTSIPPVKLRARQMVSGVKEEYVSDIKNGAIDSVANALYSVFVNGISEETETKLDYLEELNDSSERKYKVRVTDKKTGNSYVRLATREKISELRANPNIQSVEMTEYGETREGERKHGESTARAKSGKGLDPVGKEDSDVNNDGKVDKTDDYLKNRRKKIGSAIETRKEGFDFFEQRRPTKSQNTNQIMTNDEKGVVNTGVVKINPEIKESAYAKFSRILSEKAQSQQQQKLFGLALSVKRGETPRSDASSEVKNMVDDMGEKKLRDFAKTSHKGLPVRKEEMECDSKPKSKKGEDDYRSMPTKANLVKNKLRAMGLKMSYEPDGDQIDEMGPLAGLAVRGAAALGAGIAGKIMADKASKSADALKKKQSEKAKQLNQLQSYEPDGDLVDEARGEFRSLGRADRDGGRNRYMGSATPQQKREEEKSADAAAKRAKAQLARNLARESARKKR